MGTCLLEKLRNLAYMWQPQEPKTNNIPSMKEEIMCITMFQNFLDAYDLQMLQTITWRSTTAGTL